MTDFKLAACCAVFLWLIYGAGCLQATLFGKFRALEAKAKAILTGLLCLSALAFSLHWIAGVITAAMAFVAYFLAKHLLARSGGISPTTPSPLASLATEPRPVADVSDTPHLKAIPRFEPIVGSSVAIIFTAFGLLAVVSYFGFVRGTVLLVVFVLACGIVVWLPLSLIVSYLNRPEVTISEQGIAVQPEHHMVKARNVSFVRGHWRLDNKGRIVLYLFPWYYSITKAGAFPHRLIIELPDAQRSAWVGQLRAAGVPEDANSPR